MLDDRDLEFLDGRYVPQTECNRIQKESDKKFANDDKRIDILFAQMGTWNKLFWAIATACIGTLVTNILNLLS